MTETARGHVTLVGAGPGDPGLLTLAGRAALRQADCVVYDALVDRRLLDLCPAGAERVDAGKRAREHRLQQEEINQLLAERAKAGLKVVRLKGGDPLVFGRGGEEALFLAARGIAFAVIPGVTAASGAAASAGIPLTHRQIATTVTFITGHEDPEKDEPQVDYAALAQLAAGGGTLCFYMGMGRLEKIFSRLQAGGLAAVTPAAAVQWGTWPQQKTVRGTMGDLAEKVRHAGLAHPAIVFVGSAVGVDEAGLLRWFENRRLFGRHVLITRSREQASELRDLLEAEGAQVTEAPTIAFREPDDWTTVDCALGNLSRYDWLVLTSVNGVEALAKRLETMGGDARRLAPVRIAAIGTGTAARLKEKLGVKADLIPETFVGEALAEALKKTGPLKGRRLLLLRADIARQALPDLLRAEGAEVDDLPVYHTVPVEGLSDDVQRHLEAGAMHWVTLTSSSTARHLADLIGGRKNLLKGVRLASIGPVTTLAAREAGLEIAVEAARHDLRGLVEAIAGAETASGAGG